MTEQILITGGSRGIGKAIAESLSSEGYKTLSPSSTELNVQSQESIDKYFAEIESLDALVLNAGVFHSSSILKYQWEDWSRVIDINLHGCFRVIKAALPLMIAGSETQGAASSQTKNIIFISSVSADGEPYASAYAASKAAMIAMARSLAVELAKYQIRVNTICPGWVRTDMAQNILHTKEREENALGATLTGKWIEPAEIAATVSYLLNAQSITGSRFDVDAGVSV